MLQSHVNMSLKRGVKILTCVPSERKIEAETRNGEVISINAYYYYPLFRWPIPGERWVVREENGSWFLEGIYEAQGTEGSNLKTEAGDAVFSSSSGRLLLNQHGELTLFTGVREPKVVEPLDGLDIAIGKGALKSITGIGTAKEEEEAGVEEPGQGFAGGFNVAIGQECMESMRLGYHNTGMGANNMPRLLGSNNTAVGANCLEIATYANQNTAFGISALEGVTTGQNNTAVGTNAGSNVANGLLNVHIGASSGRYGIAQSHNTCVGYATMYGGTEHKATEITTCTVTEGSAILTAVSVEWAKLIRGQSLSTKERGEFGIPYKAWIESWNEAKKEITMNVKATSNHSGAKIVVEFKGESSFCVALGAQALEKFENGSANIAIGYSTLSNLKEGVKNTAIGTEALNKCTVGYNTAVGNKASYSVTTGERNTMVGNSAGELMTVCTGNTGIGFEVLAANKVGEGNTAIGHKAGHNVTGGGNIFIGNEAGYEAGAASNQLHITNYNATEPMIQGEFPNKSLALNAEKIAFFKKPPINQPAKPAENFPAVIKVLEELGLCA